MEFFYPEYVSHHCKNGYEKKIELHVRTKVELPYYPVSGVMMIIACLSLLIARPCLSVGEP